VPNGVPSAITKKTHTVDRQAKGNYDISLEIEMGALRTRAESGFSLR